MNLSNEVVLGVLMIVDLLFVLLMFRYGKAGLYSTIILNLILIATFGAKLIPVFRWVTNAGNIFYVAVCTAIVMITEHYGKEEGYKAIWAGLGSTVAFILFAQLTIRLAGIPEVSAVSEAMTFLFRAVPRIALASAVAFVVSQRLNAWLFDYLHQRTGRRLLWFRRIAAGTLTQVGLTRLHT